MGISSARTKPSGPKSRRKKKEREEPTFHLGRRRGGTGELGLGTQERNKVVCLAKLAEQAGDKTVRDLPCSQLRLACVQCHHSGPLHFGGSIVRSLVEFGGEIGCVLQ